MSHSSTNLHDPDAQVVEPQTPLVVEMGTCPSVPELLRKLAGNHRLVCFDSAQLDASERALPLGRYSYVAVDPFRELVLSADHGSPLRDFAHAFNRWRALRVEGLPPWQGGAALLLSYELGRSLEQLPAARWNEFELPGLSAFFYDTVIAIDHQQQRAWCLAHGFPEIDAARRIDRAQARIDQLLGQLEGDSSASQAIETCGTNLTIDQLAPQYEVNGVLSNFSREGYLQALQQVIANLNAGEAFQVNLAQRLLLPGVEDPVNAYLRLRDANAAPFAAYLDAGDWQLMSASPERFLSVRKGRVETRPIKGTRPRGRTPEEDGRLGQQLLCSEKDRAENVMIVDLMRNDLSRVCREDSVQVPTLFGLEHYAHVQHLVSAVEGELREGLGPIDLLEASFPGGSVTGAPKVRAQELIAELEPTARGAYCGSLAWISFADEQGTQSMDSSILIRTLTNRRGWLQAPVGGGVTVLSNPEHEYEETWHKAAGLIDPFRSKM